MPTLLDEKTCELGCHCHNPECEYARRADPDTVAAARRTIRQETSR